MFGSPQSFCLCCENYSEYLQATSLIDRLNTCNNKYPITYDLVSGSDNPDSIFEKRWLEISCEKPVRIKHFIDELEEEVKFIHRLSKQNSDLSHKPKPEETSAKHVKLPTFKRPGKSSKQKNSELNEYTSLADLANFLFQFEEKRFSKDKDDEEN